MAQGPPLGASSWGRSPARVSLPARTLRRGARARLGAPDRNYESEQQ